MVISQGFGEQIDVSSDDLARAFNEWQRRYIDEPEKFQREWEAIRDFLDAEEHGEIPSYGTVSAEYLLSIIRDQRQKEEQARLPEAERGEMVHLNPATAAKE